MGELEAGQGGSSLRGGPRGHELQSELTPQTPGYGELASLPQGGGLLPCLAGGWTRWGCDMRQIAQLRYQHWLRTRFFICFLIPPVAPLMSLLYRPQLILMGSHVLGPSGHRAWCKCGNIGRTLAGHSGAEHTLPSRDTTVPSFSKGAEVGCGQERTASGASCRLGHHNSCPFTNTHSPLSSLLS